MRVVLFRTGDLLHSVWLDTLTLDLFPSLWSNTFVLKWIYFRFWEVYGFLLSNRTLIVTFNCTMQMFYLILMFLIRKIWSLLLYSLIRLLAWRYMRHARQKPFHPIIKDIHCRSINWHYLYPRHINPFNIIVNYMFLIWF